MLCVCVIRLVCMLHNKPSVLVSKKKKKSTRKGMNNTVRIFKRIVRMLKSHSYAIVVKYYVCCRVVRYYL